ncbi:hydroxyacid dehydrogenase [Pollutimonas subterranea]|uniref:Hydroxyacid dehydrogenase n=1 Tax=Pollutimonas subterranea TaxID=2045210 RepID=A0A2N4U6T7_9BURK|nr:C-terminal binding protein [Pollutimonas subterranea]PLC50731.1 hydroxyacid dehydrogenase [Pollutimonas subterranea]
MKPKVVITDSVSADLSIELAMLDGHADVIYGQGKAPEELQELLRDADAVLNCYTRLSEDMVNGMQKCKIIARSGIGVDTVPVGLATQKGIKVTNVPDYCIDEVADHTLALMLALRRGIDQGATQARQGLWNLKGLTPIHRNAGCKLGLIGFGNIAQAVAKRARTFKFEIIVYDPFLSADAARAHEVKQVALEELLSQADVLSLHVPLNEHTQHMIGDAALRQIKPGAIVINTARGGLIDTKALLKALDEGRIAGAALDVLEQEPPQDLQAISRTRNLMLTPHAAFYSVESEEELRTKSVAEIVRVLNGEEPKYWVNKKA